MLIKLILSSLQLFIKAWLLNGLTVPMRELPVFICSNSSLDKAFGVINKSAFLMQSNLE